MLHELIHAVNFDNSGTFIEPSAHNSGSHERGVSHHDSQQHSLDSSLESSNASGSAASSSSSSSTCVPCPAALPSFESFLAMPRGFMAAHALRSATEATLLLDIAGLAIEMDTIVECAVEQIHDRQQITRQLTATQALEAQGGASLATTLVALLRQATMSNTKTLTALLQRLQACVDRLSYMRCIEANTTSANEFATHDSSVARSHRLLAQAEEELFRRLESLLNPLVDFEMTPFTVPTLKPHQTTGAAARVCWTGSLSLMASTNSPQRAQDDVRLSSSASSSSSSVSVSSSTTLIRERQASLYDDHNQSQSLSKSSSEAFKHHHNGGNTNDSSSSGSGRQHSQPRL